ncbi:DUF6477 family protein [Pseudaestuariivita rosea]|uniref:DUF6477 family protein n=1 Tax=Pseudaestuariivita rosea TaxID=2763263 RepID=UPI001ABBB8B5|nr:DUF6477 family protein [Pseudaestuariivita rosea]
MTDLMTFLQNLRRPSLLIDAARFGVKHYKRGKYLRQVLRSDAVLSHGAALAKLISAEAELEDQRKTGDVAYNCRRHLEVLIAMMGEAELMQN